MDAPAADPVRETATASGVGMFCTIHALFMNEN